MAATEEAIAVTDPAAPASEALALARRAAEAYRREDLIRRVDVAARRLAAPSIRLMVVGEFKQGKSSLVNALLGADICPVDDHLATSVPTVVSFGEPPGARAVIPPTDGGMAIVEELPLERVPGLVLERGGSEADTSDASGPDRGETPKLLDHLEVGIPAEVLKGGLALVDTPGVGGLGSAQTAATVAALPWSTALLFVSDASQEYTASEIDFLRLAGSLCPNVLCVLSKTDLYPEWRRILELDREHLREAGFPFALLPVSSVLRRHALEQREEAADQESGFPALLVAVQEVKANARRLAARAAAADVLFVVGQLEGTLQRERQASSDPDVAARLVAELAGARERADRLRGATSRWGITLGDGVADLGADLDHDLRLRTRAVIAEAEDAIDAADPAQAWGEFEAWLTRRVAAEVEQNYALLAQRAAELTERVSEFFQGEEIAVGLSREAAPPTDRLEGIHPGAVTAARQSMGQRGLMALRGVYSGASMFGSLSSLAGLAMLHPATMVLGLLMGRSAIRDQKQRELAARRQQAKAAVRRYVEEVSLHVGKDSKDTLRAIQRELRDGFGGRAEELTRSVNEALAAAQHALQSDQSERERRVSVLGKDLHFLAGVRQRAAAVAPDLAGGGSAGGGRP